MSENLFDPIAQAREAGASAIDEPIINRPYEEPHAHWQIVNLATGEQTSPTLIEGRRPAGYFFDTKKKRAEGSKMHEEFVPMNCVNQIRERVRDWRKHDYRGVTQITRTLLEHWRREEREQPLFFCQLEAVETIIWLHEAHAADRQGLFVENPLTPSPSPPSRRGESTLPTLESGSATPLERVELDAAHEAFRRYCCKMATGTGKTVVMGMIIAWSTLNKIHYPTDTRFSDAVLLVAPGLTVKDRLSVLMPGNANDYYTRFDLVPPALRDAMGRALIHVLHRQEMAVLDDTRKRGVQKLGKESDNAFANRLLKRQLGSKQRILVLNDEGHHCYKPLEKPADPDKPSKDEKEENERAAQWITGLEKIAAARGILTCIDLSATPFYIHGSGYPVGRPFPWIVSDFGLVDAIESGLVKIPRIPVDENRGDAKSPPAYFHLWQWVNSKLPTEERETLRRKAKPEPLVREAEPAIITMVGNWKKEFESWREQDWKVPPVMIVVCPDTTISELVYKRLTKDEFEFQDLKNTPSQQVTYLYDSSELSKAEEGEKAKDAEQRKRAVMNTVGKEGEPGEQVRCIVSVSMLTEGWDANNVTQIIGLRGFTSQLLCEQVVGRALRRRSYAVDPETGMLLPEYADVYGVPFQVIPVKARDGGAVPPPPPSFLVRSLDERAHLKLSFPRVEGYLTDIQEALTLDWSKLPTMKVSAEEEPTVVHVKGVVGYRVGRPDIGGPGTLERQDRVPFYQLARVGTATFKMASEILRLHVPGESEADIAKRGRLFPQVLEIVRRFVAEHIVFERAPEGELNLEKWQARIVNVLVDNIAEKSDDGSAHILPRIERYRPEGHTGEVFFRTGRPVRETVRSHISHVVIDSTVWENDVYQTLEHSDFVDCYARNDHLDFTIPYTDSLGAPRTHRPDFLVRLRSGLMVALEVKGYERDLDKLKIAAGHKWASSVNRYYGERRWIYHACHAPIKLETELAQLATA